MNRTRRRKAKARRKYGRLDPWESAPYVCPGCYAVAGPCAPGCVDAVIEEDRLINRQITEDCMASYHAGVALEECVGW